MSRIRSRGNKDTELALVRVFRECGITGWRRHVPIRISERRTRNRRPARTPIRNPKSAVRIFKVRPDFVFPKLRVAVFVDGCFWHACPIHATNPKGNATFWRKKLAANQDRDRRVNRELKRAGWRVVRVWEHDFAVARRGRLVARILRHLG